MLTNELGWEKLIQRCYSWPFSINKPKFTTKMENNNNIQQLTDDDYTMAEYIWKLLKLQQITVWSWGVDPNSVKTIEKGTQFHVQGFLMTGTVKITYDEVMDLFDLELQPDDPEKPRKAILGIYMDNLVSTIDQNVEYCEDYVERILEEYSSVV